MHWERYTDPHPYRLTKRRTQKFVQMYVETYSCIYLQTLYMNVQVEIEIYKHIREKEADRHTQACMSIDLCMQT